MTVRDRSGRTRGATNQSDELNVDGEWPIAVDREFHVCRGCAGSGLRFDFPAVARQIAEMAIAVPRWTDPVTGRHRARTIPGVGQLAPFNPGAGTPRITDTRWTLRDVLHTHRLLSGLGAEPERDPNFTEQDACPWCHGTGRPQLSIHVLEEATRAR